MSSVFRKFLHKSEMSDEEYLQYMSEKKLVNLDRIANAKSRKENEEKLNFSQTLDALFEDLFQYILGIISAIIGLAIVAFFALGAIGLAWLGIKQLF